MTRHRAWQRVERLRFYAIAVLAAVVRYDGRYGTGDYKDAVEAHGAALDSFQARFG